MYDIVFISYGEANADSNWDKLKQQYPMAKRVKDVKGIHQAHIAAAKKCFTKMFWVVDADAQILDTFNFDHKVDEYDLVHVWRAENPVNGLEYGYGGVKLLPRMLTLKMDTTTDMTTSISDKFKAMTSVSNITAFNTDPLSTWRGAFRECAKLASKTIQGQLEEETNDRLKTWTTYATGSYKRDALRGANAGMQFGHSSSSDLNLINNFDWLKEQFDNDTI